MLFSWKALSDGESVHDSRPIHSMLLWIKFYMPNHHCQQCHYFTPTPPPYTCWNNNLMLPNVDGATLRLNFLFWYLDARNTKNVRGWRIHAVIHSFSFTTIHIMPDTAVSRRLAHSQHTGCLLETEKKYGLIAWARKCHFLNKIRSNWPPHRISWSSELLLRRYLQNNTGVCLIKIFNAFFIFPK